MHPIVELEKVASGSWLLQVISILPEFRGYGFASQLLRKVEKFIVLKTIDEKWRNHLLGMDQLREGIGLRAYGQKNPLIEYKSESYNFFQELMISLRSTVIQRVFHAQVSDQVQTQQSPLQKNIQLKHDEVANDLSLIHI